MSQEGAGVGETVTVTLGVFVGVTVLVGVTVFVGVFVGVTVLVGVTVGLNVGVCAKASAGNGRVFVKVQNGYEFSELHDVSIVAVADKNHHQNNQISYYLGIAI